MYIDFVVKDKEYKLRLNTRNIVNLEKQLGMNPLSIFGAGDTIPTVTVMVQILHASMQQYHHGITLNDAMDIFDTWLEDNSVTEFLPIIVDIYRASGIIKEETEKNV